MTKFEKCRTVIYVSESINGAEYAGVLRNDGSVTYVRDGKTIYGHRDALFVRYI